MMVLTFIITASGCAPIEVVSQHEPGFDFKSLKTFQILKNQQQDIQDVSMPKELLDKSFETAFTNALTEKGFSKAEADPDFLISYYVVVKTIQDTLYIHTYYNNIGYYGADNISRSKPRVDIVEYQVGSLVVDIIDTKSKGNIWRGSAATPVGLYKDEEKQVKRINTVVQKILKSFPPE